MKYKILTTSGGYKKPLYIDADCNETAVIACKALGANFALLDDGGEFVAKSRDTVYNSLCMTKEREESYIKDHYNDIINCLLSCRVKGYRRDDDNFRAYATRIAGVFKYMYEVV